MCNQLRRRIVKASPHEHECARSPSPALARRRAEIRTCCAALPPPLYPPAMSHGSKLHSQHQVASACKTQIWLPRVWYNNKDARRAYVNINGVCHLAPRSLTPCCVTSQPRAWQRWAMSGFNPSGIASHSSRLTQPFSPGPFSPAALAQ